LQPPCGGPVTLHRAAVAFRSCVPGLRTVGGAAMSTRAEHGLLLRRLYGFDFPDDLFTFWDFANRVRPLEPLNALVEATGTHLVGPFEVLAGRFAGRTPSLPLSLHWRYHDDPPEFFTVLRGATDGLHWGYYLDDPAAGAGCVASYYANAAFEISADGDDLFEAIRLDLERHAGDCADALLDDPEESLEEKKRQIDVVRTRLLRFATGDRPEQGREYEEAYPERSARAARVVAATREGMGIVVPPETYRPLALKDRRLWQRLRKEGVPGDILAEAHQALKDGFPGTALKLGKDLWALGGGERSEHAYELLDSAYAALGRGVLREVLRIHRANRDLPSVDVLENERSGRDE
jgi:Uncharacterised conserved protein (DUF2228)